MPTKHHNQWQRANPIRDAIVVAWSIQGVREPEICRRLGIDAFGFGAHRNRIVPAIRAAQTRMEMYRAWEAARQMGAEYRPKPNPASRPAYIDALVEQYYQLAAQWDAELDAAGVYTDNADSALSAQSDRVCDKTASYGVDTIALMGLCADHWLDTCNAPHTQR